MNIKEILNEWNSFLEKEIISEQKQSFTFKDFITKHSDFDVSRFSSELKGNSDYLQIISNSIQDNQSHDPYQYAEQFRYFKSSIVPNREDEKFLENKIPGEIESGGFSLAGKVNPGSCTATFEDIQKFQQDRMFNLGKGSKSKIITAHKKIIEEANTNDFELITEDSNWIVFYPKSVKGSIALAKSYWDGSKVSYDETFSSSKGFGQNTGKINWCTSVSGSGNMFLDYHRRRNLHMYYCIKKNISDVNDPGRKICVSFSKENKKVQFSEGSESVDGDNSQISKKQARAYLGSLFNIIQKDVKKDSRLEIDEESYYRAISLEKYLLLRRANEEDIDDFINEVKGIVEYSKDREKIIKACIEDKNEDIALIGVSATSDINDILSLAKSTNFEIKKAIAVNENSNQEVLNYLLNTNILNQTVYDNEAVLLLVLISNNPNSEKDFCRNILLEVVESLLRSDKYLLSNIASMLKLNEYKAVFDLLIKTKDRDLIKSLTLNSNLANDQVQDVIDTNLLAIESILNMPLSEEIIIKFYRQLDSQDSEFLKRNEWRFAMNKNCPSEILDELSKSENISTRESVAQNKNTSRKTLEYLSNDPSDRVLYWVEERLKTEVSLIRKYAKLVLS